MVPLWEAGLQSEDWLVANRFIRAGMIRFPNPDAIMVATPAQASQPEINKPPYNQVIPMSNEEEKPSIEALLTELEETLANGELKNATPLEQQIREQLEAEAQGDQPEGQRKALEQRLQSCVIKIKELKGWQYFGNKTEREQCCKQVEELLEQQSLAATDLLEAVKKIQEAWNNLEATGMPKDLKKRFNKDCDKAYQRYREHLCAVVEALCEEQPDDFEMRAKTIQEVQSTWKELGIFGQSQSLWERFHKACNTAYEPCQNHFETQARKREENLGEKEAICQRLETFETDWEQPNWKAIYRFVKDQEKQWKRVGTVPKKAKKSLNERFQKAIKPLDEKLDVERKRNWKEREKLVESIEQASANLETEAAIDSAINEVKQLQNRWQVTVPDQPRVEQQLWEKFRKVCELPFEARRKQQDARNEEFKSNLEHKKQLCDQIEALASLEGEEIASIPAKLREFKEAYTQAGMVPKNQIQSMEKRYQKACQKAEERRQQHRHLEQRKQLELLRQKANMCHILESRQLEEDQMEALVKQWEELPELQDPCWDDKIKQRFEHAINAMTENTPIGSPESLEKRKRLCLELEVLTGAQSPDSEKKARMAFQVAMLSEAMRDGEKPIEDKHQRVQQLETDWYLLQAAPAQDVTALQSRFEAALKAFQQA